MPSPEKRGAVPAWMQITIAVGLWLGVGFSLGWYYTFTYYGRAGWPMPTPEPCAALLLYYFSVLNVATEIQAVHWMLVFPLAGALWLYAQQIACKAMGMERPPLRRMLLPFALASVPLAAPGPWMAYLAGSLPEGFTWERMLQVALRRGNITPGAWLTPMYVGLGALSLALEVMAHRRVFQMPTSQRIRHLLLSMVFLTILACVTGGLASIPLRAWLE